MKVNHKTITDEAFRKWLLEETLECALVQAFPNFVKKEMGVEA